MRRAPGADALDEATISALLSGGVTSGPPGTEGLAMLVSELRDSVPEDPPVPRGLLAEVLGGGTSLPAAAATLPRQRAPLRRRAAAWAAGLGVGTHLVLGVAGGAAAVGLGGAAGVLPGQVQGWFDELVARDDGRSPGTDGQSRGERQRSSGEDGADGADEPEQPPASSPDQQHVDGHGGDAASTPAAATDPPHSSDEPEPGDDGDRLTQDLTGSGDPDQAEPDQSEPDQDDPDQADPDQSDESDAEQPEEDVTEPDDDLEQDPDEQDEPSQPAEQDEQDDSAPEDDGDDAPEVDEPEVDEPEGDEPEDDE